MKTIKAVGKGPGIYTIFYTDGTKEQFRDWNQFCRVVNGTKQAPDTVQHVPAEAETTDLLPGVQDVLPPEVQAQGLEQFTQQEVPVVAQAPATQLPPNPYTPITPQNIPITPNNIGG